MSSGFKSDFIKYYRKYVMDYMIKNFNGTGPAELQKLLINLDMTNITRSGKAFQLVNSLNLTTAKSTIKSPQKECNKLKIKKLFENKIIGKTLNASLIKANHMQKRSDMQNNKY